jgi:hypothetical protein
MVSYEEVLLEAGWNRLDLSRPFYMYEPKEPAGSVRTVASALLRPEEKEHPEWFYKEGRHPPPLPLGCYWSVLYATPCEWMEVETYGHPDVQQLPVVI